MDDLVVPAAEANRSFSRLLRRVQDGQRVQITLRGETIAIISPPADDTAGRERRLAAMKALHEHWATLEPVIVEPWTREELYERESWKKWDRQLPAAVDTNILIYAEGITTSVTDLPHMRAYRLLFDRLSLEGFWFLPAQVLAEGHNVFVRKLGLSRRQAQARLAPYMEGATIVPTTDAVLQAAFELSAGHDIPTFDAIILAAAAEARCDVLYSEDFQPGFAWRGVEVVNPFLL